MAKVEISMTADDDLEAWGPEAKEANVPQLRLNYETAAQEIAEELWPDHEIAISITWEHSLHGDVPFATLYDDDGQEYESCDLNQKYNFSDRVWDRFCMDG